MRLIFVLLISFFVATSCNQKSPLELKPRVIVSVAPYLYIVEKIAGETVIAQAIVPPGANPHIYEPTPKEVGEIRGAVLWVYLGESFDKKIYNALLESNPALKVVNVVEHVHLLDFCEENGVESEHHHCHGHEEGKDLHVWTSPKLFAEQAQRIAAMLIQLFPEHQATYSAHLQQLLSELQTLDDEIAKLLAAKRGTAILVSHPAFGYFCQEYGLTQISVEIEGKDPLPRDVSDILEQVKTHGIQTVIIEPQYSNKGALLIAERLGLKTHTIDPYAENYPDNLRSLAKVIASP